MSDEEEQATPAPAKASKLPIIIGIVLALLGGGGGFFAVQSGALDSLLGAESTDSHSVAQTSHDTDSHAQPHVTTSGDTTFIPVDSVVISLPPGHANTHLRFTAQLEARSEHSHAIESQLPRVIDVFNAYLRAVKPEDFQDPVALMRIRSHLLARLDVVLGDGWVEDLLIMEFVLT